MYSLPGPRFFAFAHRITAYEGVMSLLQQQEHEQREKGKGVTVNNATYREVPAETTTQIAAGLGEFVEVAEG